MAEENATIETEEKTESPTNDVISADGTFNEGWRNSLPEGLRDEPSLKVFSNLEGLASGFVNTKRLVGKDTVAKLNENSTEQEREEWYKASGRPETPEDYAIERPEEIAEEHWDSNFVNDAQNLFHKEGLSSNQVNAIVDFWNKHTVATRESMDTEYELAKTQAQDELRKEWGSGYDQRIHIGNLAIEQGVDGDDTFKERLTQKFGNDPDFVKFASNVGAKFTEAEVIHDPLMPTQPDWDEKIAEASAHTAYTNRADPQHLNQVKKVNELIEAKHKSLEDK